MPRLAAHGLARPGRESLLVAGFSPRPPPDRWPKDEGSTTYTRIDVCVMGSGLWYYSGSGGSGRGMTIYDLLSRAPSLPRAHPADLMIGLCVALAASRSGPCVPDEPFEAVAPGPRVPSCPGHSTASPPRWACRRHHSSCHRGTACYGLLLYAVPPQSYSLPGGAGVDGNVADETGFLVIWPLPVAPFVH